MLWQTPHNIFIDQKDKGPSSFTFALASQHGKLDDDDPYSPVLGAQIGVIVIGDESFALLDKQNARATQEATAL